MIKKEQVHKLLDKARWVFAKTMPKIPHEYTVRYNWDNDKDFVDVVLFIRKNGIEERFFRRTYIYYYYNGHKYWTMGCPISYENKKDTYILNRAKV